MLQYAVPSAPQLHPPPSLFADPPIRLSTAEQRRRSAGAALPPHPQLFRARSHESSTTSLQSASQPDQHLPALSALASLAASVPAAVPRESPSRSSTPSSMSQPQYAPAATAGGQQNGPPVCANCQTSTTPLWRRDESGSVLCNACGLFLKLHGRPRPISLKTDVIKSRNRVKTSQPKKRESIDGQHHQGPPAPQGNGYPAAHPEMTGAGLGIHHPPPHPLHLSGMDSIARAPSPTSISRSGTPGLSATHTSNIAPPHLFDTVSLPSDTFASPSLPAFALRQPSPSASSINGNGAHLEPPTQTLDALNSQNQHLRTRVSELEVINDLFRGRVAELEQTEQEARRAEKMKDEEVERVRADLETASAKMANLNKRIAELEAGQSSPARKRTRRGVVDEAEEDNEK